MENFKSCAIEMVTHILYFFRWILLALLVGGIVGSIGTLFHYSIEEATALRLTYHWLLYLLPLGGLLIVWLYRASGLTKDKGTNLIIASIRSDEERITLRMSPLIFISTTLTHLLGGSSGREGAALQLGGSLATFIGHKLHLDQNDCRIMTMCGMSAAFAALFGTPIASAVFSMEIISVGIMHYAALVPSVVAALVGYGIANSCGVTPTHFTILNIPELSFLSAGQSILLAMACAGISIIFCFMLHGAHKLYGKYFKNPYLRIAVGGMLVIALTLLVQSRSYLGAGMDVITKAASGTAAKQDFLLKMLFTALTLGAGYKGGEIVPSFFVGATFGAAFGPLLGLPASFASAIGLVSLFCGVTNCPLSAFILSLELFGPEGYLFYMLACAVSYRLSGYTSLYTKQKIVYSKYKPKYIDRLGH